MKTDALVRSHCLMTRSMAILGNKWKPIIIYALRERTMRFGQLVAVLDLISRKVLTDMLRELEKDGIVVREHYRELPPRVEYSLTEKGRELVPVLGMLADWYEKHLVHSPVSEAALTQNVLWNFSTSGLAYAPADPMQEKLREHIEKVVPLTDDEFAFILARFAQKKFRKHQFLIQEGEPVKCVYLVVSGLLKLVYTDDSGKQHIVSFAMEDWWESDFQAFHNQTPATLSLECLEDTAVFCLSLADYHTLCDGLPKMERFILKKSISGSIASQQRILSLLTSNAQERYEQLLRRQPSLFQRVSKSLLAAYLGVSRETLSRLSG